MTRIWFIVTLGFGALAQEADIEKFFSGNLDISHTYEITNELKSQGLHDCYSSDNEEMYQNCNTDASRSKKYQRGNQPSLLQFAETNFYTKDKKEKSICCIPKGFVEPESNCGVRKPEGYYMRGTDRQKRDSARTTLVGEYPWRALIWRKNREEGPFCAGTVIDSDSRVILTSADCALKYDVNMLMVTFNRTREDALTHIDVKQRLVHEDYDNRKRFVNNIALLVMDTENVNAPAWVTPACFSNRPPMHATSCTVVSAEDYFIDTVVPLRSQCEVDNKKLDVSQMCSVTLANEYKAEIGAGLFCQDRERTQNFNYYASGITLQVRGQLITYTNVSHFEKWITGKLKTISTENETIYD